MNTKTNPMFILALSALLFAPVVQADGLPSPVELSPASPTASGEARYAAGYILVKPKAGVTREQFQDALNTVGGQNESVSPFSGIHRVRVPDGLEKALAEALGRHPHIEFATPDYLSEPQSVQSGASTDTSTGVVGWHITNTRIDSAWNFTDGTGVTVAVLDTGFTLNHPDLLGKFLDGWNVANNTADLSPTYEHGTPVAGIVGASRNGQGVVGVAPGAMLLPVRVTADGANVATTSAIADGIHYAADHGAKVINISFNSSREVAILDAVNYAKSRGAVTVISAGNDNQSHDESPTSLQALVVGALVWDTATQTVRRANFFNWGSNWGGSVDLVAPGYQMPSTSDKRDLTTGAYGYSTFDGTSMAAPVVSGVAALMMAENPSLTPTDVIAILQNQGLPLPDVCPQTNADGTTTSVTCFPRGRTVRAARAVMAAGGLPIDETSPVVAFANGTDGATLDGVQTFSVSATDNASVVRVELYVNGQRIGEDVTAPYEFVYNLGQLGVGAVTLEARAYDGAGNLGTARASVTIPSRITDTESPKSFLNVFGTELRRSGAKLYPALYKPGTDVLVRQQFWRARGNIRFQVSATDNVGVTELTLYINDVPVATDMPVAPRTMGILTYDVNAYYGSGRILPMRLVAKDAAGNVTTQEWDLRAMRKPPGLVLHGPAPW